MRPPGRGPGTRAPAPLSVLDIDATLITAHSETQEAAGTWKGGFGFHPLLCYLDETGEPLAGLLRPGNAGSNTAADHFELLELALDQPPEADLDREILVRSDVGGATHDFAWDCHSAGVRFSVGYAVDERVREAILSLPEPPTPTPYLPSYAGSTVTSTADNGGSRLVGAPDRNSSYASRSEASEESHVSISADHDLRLPGTARAGFGTRERRMASPTSKRGDERAGMVVSPPPQASERRHEADIPEAAC